MFLPATCKRTRKLSCSCDTGWRYSTACPILTSSSFSTTCVIFSLYNLQLLVFSVHIFEAQTVIVRFMDILTC